MFSLLRPLLAAAFLINLAFLAFELAGWFRRAGAKKSLIIIAASAVVFSAMVFATRGTPLRGGYDNEHDFGFVSSSFFGGQETGSASDKEASPQIVVSAADWLSGSSFDGILWANKILWGVCAALLFAFLTRLGFGLPAAFLGTGLFSLNFLSVLNSYTFASTNANLFYFLSALVAVSLFLEGEAVAAKAAWAGAAVFLALSARYEFFPVLVWLGLLAAVFGFRRFRRPSPGFWIAAAVSVSVFALWFFHLNRITNYNGPTKEVFTPLANIAVQLGEKNLSLVFGVPAGAWLWITGFLFAAAALGFFRKPRAAGLAFLFLVGWVLYFALIYLDLEEYPLHFMRHRLYFFIPFSVLAAAAVDTIFPLRFSKQSAYLVSIFLAGWYLPMNLRISKDFRYELRTNDLEWQFLYSAGKNWPPGCSAIYPYGDAKKAILRKYFPLYEGNGPVPACALVYKTPRYELIAPAAGRDERRETELREFSESWRAAAYPWRETVFSHRFFTAWHGCMPGMDVETILPLPAVFGFYYTFPGE